MTPTAGEALAGHVVDASVLVGALVDSAASGLWCEGVVAGGYLVAPHLAVVESLNILRRLELAGQLSELEAASAQSDLHDLQLELLPIRPFEERIWELRPNLTCYDAWYVAIAEALDLPLATLDRRLAAATGPRCEFRLPG
ncbi:MAG TPA: type II toxin-antitoxin system VapC family toxin [Thermoanaerobaculia bacterium]|nr:type II toxin-antitoxin system VapC family toxin [Thermoanaerobaculia bacterium]